MVSTENDDMAANYRHIGLVMLISLFMWIMYTLWDINVAHTKLEQQREEVERQRQEEAKKQAEMAAKQRKKDEINFDSDTETDDDSDENNDENSDNKENDHNYNDENNDKKEMFSMASPASNVSDKNEIRQRKSSVTTMADQTEKQSAVPNVIDEATQAKVQPQTQTCEKPKHGACANMATFDAKKIISKGKAKKMFELPKVEQLGTITIKQLNQYHCDADRQCLSLMGTVYDVTEAKYKYGKDGSYKSFAGHDITLALGSGKLEDKWLDQFVKYTPKCIDAAKGWQELYEKQYPKCGKLDVWENSDPSKWRQLTSQEREELDKECIVM